MVNQKWITAVHETSHAVVAYELRHAVTVISVEGDGDKVLGFTTIPTREDWDEMLGDGMDATFVRRYKNRKRGSLAVCLAGDVGNDIDGNKLRDLVSKRVPKGVFDYMMAHGGHAEPGLNERDDVKKALEVAIDCWQDPVIEIANAEERARRILTARWRKVLRIAKLLMKREKMEGVAVIAALCHNR